jgi:hypothetical protein
MISSVRLDCLATDCMTIEGATSTEVQAHVLDQVVPYLRPGDIVVMDTVAP